MSVTAAIRRMLDAGLSLDHALIAAEAMEAEAENVVDTRTPRQQRNARYYIAKKEREASESRLKASNSDVSDTLSSPAPSLNDVVPSSSTVENNLNPNPTPPIVPPAPKAASPKASADQRERFWANYPSRGDKANPKKPALALFDRAVARGVDPEVIIVAAKRYRGTFDGPSEYAMQAERWLRNECWEQYSPAATTFFADKPKPTTAPQSPEVWSEQRWKQAISYARLTHQWPASLGPCPGEPGCLAPSHLVRSDDRQNLRAA